MATSCEKFIGAFEYVKAQLNGRVPEIGLVLGSGLGFFADSIENQITIPYGDIPNFPKSTVVGHAGQFVIGDLHGKTLICMQGRVHYYEGHSIESVVLPIRLMAKLGVSKLIVTNAAGGIASHFRPGTLMIINDHINELPNPLIGPNDDSMGGARFPDMSACYSKRLGVIAKEMSDAIAADLQEGVYLGTTGPSYETPAEIRKFRTYGADAVGMSTVPEVIVARHCGLEVFGMSCITNLAAGMQASLNHEEVTETAKAVSGSFVQVIDHVVKHIDREVEIPETPAEDQAAKKACFFF